MKLKEKTREEQLVAQYAKEPGIVREFRKVDRWACARVRTAYEGKELWRRRDSSRTYDYPVDSYEIIHAFIAADA